MSRLIRYIGKDNITALTGNIPASFLGIVSFSLFAKMMTIEDFGGLMIFLSYAGVLELLRTGLVRQAMVRLYLSSAKDKQIVVLATASIIHLIAGTGLILAAKTLSLLLRLPEELTFFTNWYPWYLAAQMTHQMASWIAQAKSDFFRTNIYRLILNLVIIILTLYHRQDLNLHLSIQILIGANIMVSGVAFLLESDLRRIPKWNRSVGCQIIGFGRHSLMTLLGSNLLKTSDILIIGWFMGKEMAAIYAIPAKMIELMDIPLRSFTITTFQKLIQHYNSNHQGLFLKVLKASILKTTILAIPISFLLMVFPEVMVSLIAKDSFLDRSIFLVIGIVLLLLPADKLIGASLDSANRPSVNTRKVWIMVFTNAVGDLLVMYFDGPLFMIALITLLNLSLGIVYALIKHPFIPRWRSRNMTPAGFLNSIGRSRSTKNRKSPEACI